MLGALIQVRVTSVPKIMIHKSGLVCCCSLSYVSDSFCFFRVRIRTRVRLLPYHFVLTTMLPLRVVVVLDSRSSSVRNGVTFCASWTVFGLRSGVHLLRGHFHTGSQTG